MPLVTQFTDCVGVFYLKMKGVESNDNTQEGSATALRFEHVLLVSSSAPCKAILRNQGIQVTAGADQATVPQTGIAALLIPDPDASHVGQVLLRGAHVH